MEYIRTRAELEDAAARIGSSRLLAVDTEAAGYHRYHDRICLVQLSTRGSTFIVDTLAVSDLEPLRDPFEDPQHEIVLHDADYDLRLLWRDHGLHIRGLFDTKIAAQLIGETAFGLGALVEKFVGVQLDKKHQRADWAQRPLPADMLAYAAEDTQHLPALRDRLKAELERLGRWSWAEEEFSIREQSRWDAEPDEDAYLRLKNTRDLLPRQMAALRELYEWREGVAERRDVATFRVVGNDVLVNVARELPASEAELRAVPAVPGSIAERHGADLLDAVRRALAFPESELPRRIRGPRRPPPDADFDALVERLKKVRDSAADELALDRGFLMARHQLETVARERPQTVEQLIQIPDIRRWQAAALGEQLVGVLRRK